MNAREPGHCTGRFLLTLVAAATLAWPAANARAVEVGSLYTAQAPLEGNDTKSRDKAYASAFSQVLARVTGNVDPLQSARIAGLFPDPSHYVLQYRPGEDNTLWVTFDGNAIERILRQSNMTFWGSDRPLTLIWLAVDWGEGEREIVAAGEPVLIAGEERSIDRNRLLRERVQDAALQRGIPVAFPLLDAEDREGVSFSDIWGGFDDLLLRASDRYGANSILVGRVRPQAGEGNRWSWYFGGEQREWSGEPEGAINMLADALAAQFAIAGDAPLDTITLTVSGIDSVAAFGAVQSFMEQLDIVDELAVDMVSGDRVRYRITAHGGKERLRRTLEFSDMLQPVDDYDRTDIANADPGLDALSFRYRP
ncbi:MAG: DUF2066 domain-containing protein [Woeseiaceae bacterium]